MPIRRQYQPIGSPITYPARALDTIYQNTTGRPLLVICTISCNVALAGDVAYAIAQVEAVTPPTQNHARAGISQYSVAAIWQGYWVLTFIVPAGLYYRVASIAAGLGTVAVGVWSELSLIEPFSAGF